MGAHGIEVDCYDDGLISEPSRLRLGDLLGDALDAGRRGDKVDLARLRRFFACLVQSVDTIDTRRVVPLSVSIRARAAKKNVLSVAMGFRRNCVVLTTAWVCLVYTS